MANEEHNFELQPLATVDDGFSRAVMVRIRGVKRRRYAVLACAMAAGMFLALPGLVELIEWMGTLSPALPTAAQNLMTIAAATPLAIYGAVAAASLLGVVLD